MKSRTPTSTKAFSRSATGSGVPTMAAFGVGVEGARLGQRLRLGFAVADGDDLALPVHEDVLDSAIHPWQWAARTPSLAWRSVGVGAVVFHQSAYFATIRSPSCSPTRRS